MRRRPQRRAAEFQRVFDAGLAQPLALGQLDEHYERDLAIAAGSELVIVHDRDRKLSLTEIQPAKVAPAVVDQYALPFAIASLALGNFLSDKRRRTEVALLAEDGAVYVLKKPEARSKKQEARLENAWQRESLSAVHYPRSTQLIRANVSSLPTDDLIALDQVNHQLHIFSGQRVNESMSH